MNYFFCYDPNLSRYLKANGFEYVTRAKHYKSNKEFTLFEINQEIENLITQWKNKQLN